MSNLEQLGLAFIAVSFVGIIVNAYMNKEGLILWKNAMEITRLSKKRAKIKKESEENLFLIQNGDGGEQIRGKMKRSEEELERIDKKINQLKKYFDKFV